MEQLVARWAHNPKAVGSSPAPATTKLWHLCRGFFFMSALYTSTPILPDKKSCLNFC